MLAAARHQNKRGTEELVASLRLLPDVPAIVRRLPAPAPTSSALTRLEVTSVPVVSVASASAPAVHAQPKPCVTPIAPERYKIQFTATRSTHDKLRRAQDLLRHALPNGDPAEIFDRALTLLVNDLERTRLASVTSPRPGRAAAEGSRHIPAHVKRIVWSRDAGRCAFIGARGRCPETGFLEWHHVRPFAVGGGATADNIQLRCRAHNAHEAASFFGDGRHEAAGDILVED